MSDNRDKPTIDLTNIAIRLGVDMNDVSDKPKSEAEFWKKEALMTLDGHNLLGASREHARRLLKTIELNETLKLENEELRQALRRIGRAIDEVKYREKTPIEEICMDAARAVLKGKT